MHKLTKICLRKPVSAFIVVIALILFGFTAIPQMNMQLTPDMEFPMIIAYTIYPQAKTEEVDRLVSQKLEDVGGTIEGLDYVQTRSSENLSYAIYSFDYGTDTDQAYMDLQQEIQRIDLPDGCENPRLIVADIDAASSINLSVRSKTGQDVLNFVNDTFEPELSTIANVASTTIRGGQEDYVSVKLIPELMTQYGVTMSALSSAIAAADFALPAGNVDMGGQKIGASTTIKLDSIQSLKDIPITTGSGQIIHLSDVATVNFDKKTKTSISRFNSVEDVTIGVVKTSGSNAVSLSRDVNALIEEYAEKYPNIDFAVIYDSAKTIKSSLKNVAETLVLGIVLSMVVLFAFFGDLKASFIVGSSMPVSLLVTVILMKAMGYSLNVVTTGALVIGIGMMVDNSIVVLEMCFQKKDAGFSFEDAAYDSVKTVALSITASTITTVVVYAPLATIKGLAGQMFGPLGFTIIFSLTASLFSAVTLVPLCYAKYKPIENKGFFMNKSVRKLGDAYGRVLKPVLDKKVLAAIIGVVLMVLSCVCVKFIHTELQPSSDEGLVNMTVKVRPGLSLEMQDIILTEMEEFVKADPNVENYSVQTDQGAAEMTVKAYLKDECKIPTKLIANEWNEKLKNHKNCSVNCQSGTSSSMGSRTSGTNKEVDVRCLNMDTLKLGVSMIEDAVRDVPGVLTVETSFSNSQSKAEIQIDPIKAQAAGIPAGQAANNIYLVKNGKEAMEISINDDDYKVVVEYPKEQYDQVNDLLNLSMTTNTGKQIMLSDIATIVYTDTPQTITRQDKYYRGSVTCYLDSELQYDAEKQIDEIVSKLNLPNGVTEAENTRAKMMRETFTEILIAIATALWLVFMVMTMQFESARYAGMIMLCIPFSLIGSFGLLLLTGATLSMNSLMGFLMLEGIVVNNGILFVDTANVYRETMSLEVAMIETGKNRLRPILMTTLTTVLSMIPMAVGYGKNGQLMQGMAVVIVGGLIASTLLTLLLLPCFYCIIRKKDKVERKSRRKFFSKKQKDKESVLSEQVETGNANDEGVDN